MKNNFWLTATLALVMAATVAWNLNRTPATPEITLPEVEITAPALMPEITLPEVTIQAKELPISTLALPEVTIRAKKRTGV